MKQRIWMCALALAGMWQGWSAGADPRGFTPPPRPNKVQIIDVSLVEGGTLYGQVVDTNGIPQGNTLVYVRQSDKILATTPTNKTGEFTVPGLRGGVYQVVTANGGGVFRLWTPGTAPPAARESVLVVGGEHAVRGALEPGPLRRTLVVGGIAVLSGVGGGAIGYAIRDNKDGS